ncbi:AIPR family protein [Brachyspira hyodysenteriae]|uniref:AIPR family protein n=1 Tax=Brachyspira hyodysenteriae TaxID=159 RepID=UPI00063DB72A|nr:AIPR family protein [Brachyspira hyodysenteriae]KLI21600.1 hypothetical protein SU46_01895 [Brachyspira hyodysenteriae]KLI32571.1 hypothetical protein SZ49_01760 [Brachyspira hyodysenteriae]KLI36818.1 hypothetical protein SZ51_11605 [Brachyspira hyodysenteriae]
MNQIIKGYITKFRDEILLDKKLKDETVFEHFINYITVKRDFLDDFLVEDIHIGGGNDNGIDGLAIIVNDEIITDLDLLKNLIDEHNNIFVSFVFTQSKTSSNIDSGDLYKFFEGVINFFNEDTEIPLESNFYDLSIIKNYIFENSSILKENPKIYLKYAYTGNNANDKNISNILHKYNIKFKNLSLFSHISINILDFDDIQKIYKEIRLNVKKTICLERITTLPYIHGVQESYIGIIPLKEFFNLVCDNDRIIKSIFYDNVRDYQGDTIVNKEIANTMLNENESKYFGLYHNGVTIVAKTLKKTGENITLENFQIVNGCQTSHIIAKNFNKVKNGVDKMFIPVKLIATENNDIINSVIKATNRHNEVKTEAFESLKDFHKELEEFYNSKNQESNMPIYYERRSKQYIYNDKIERFSIVTLSQQIRTYLSMFEEIPQSVHRYYGELLSVYGEKSNMFKKVNNKKHFDLYYIASFAFVKINLFIIRGNIYDRYKPFRHHILFIFKLMIANELSVRTKQSIYNEMCSKMYKILYNDDELLEYFKKCCKIIESTIKEYPKSQYKKLTRITDFTNKLRNKVIN